MIISIPPEVAARIASTFRGMPALVSLIGINLIFTGLIAWALWVQADLRYKERSELIRIVDRCIDTGRR